MTQDLPNCIHWAHVSPYLSQNSHYFPQNISDHSYTTSREFDFLVAKQHYICKTVTDARTCRIIANTLRRAICDRDICTRRTSRLCRPGQSVGRWDGLLQRDACHILYLLALARTDAQTHGRTILFIYTRAHVPSHSHQSNATFGWKV